MSEADKKQNVFGTFESLGVQMAFVIQESFLGYKYRKASKKLYDTDSDIPENLIRLYYGMNPNEATFDTMKKAFIRHYIKNESEIEGIDVKKIHSQAEVKGLAAMYEYIHSEDVNYMFDVYTLKDLNQKLFSFVSHPEYAGDFRSFDVYLPGAGANLCPWYLIRNQLNEIDKEVQKIITVAPIIRRHESMEALFAYMDRCIEISCKLIKVHPFVDGNGRTVRGFLNKLFEDVGLPPVYIKANERTEYHKAMNLANNDGDYSAIYQFYRYKICDSIIELDINERMKPKTPEEFENKMLKRQLKP